MRSAPGRSRARAAWAHRAQSWSGSAAPQLAEIVRERRADGDVVPERPDAREVVRAEPREQLFARRRAAAAGCPPCCRTRPACTMSRMGWGVLSNRVIGCGLPSSRTSKSSRVSVVTSRPSRSVTVTKTRTASPVPRNDRLLRRPRQARQGQRRRVLRTSGTESCALLFHSQAWQPSSVISRAGHESIDTALAPRKTTTSSRFLVPAPTMWKPFKCRLFREHDYQLCREPGALYLACRRCGHRSPGWELSGLRVKRADSPLRLVIADAEEALRAVRGGDDAGAEMWATLMDSGELRLTLGQEE